MDIYNMICKISNLNAAANDGDSNRVTDYTK